MLKNILRFGIIAGLIVATPMIWFMARMRPDAGIEAMGGYLRGYIIMLIALSMVFVGIKHYRDRALGGVIKFGTAFVLGLGITAVAGVFYVVGWEIASAVSDWDFAKAWSDSMVAGARARGAAPAELERVAAEAAEFGRTYANPLFRIPMVFLEIFPVGILVSLISAGILRKPGLTTAPPAANDRIL